MTKEEYLCLPDYHTNEKKPGKTYKLFLPINTYFNENNVYYIKTIVSVEGDQVKSKLNKVNFIPLNSKKGN